MMRCGNAAAASLLHHFSGMLNLWYTFRGRVVLLCQCYGLMSGPLSFAWWPQAHTHSSSCISLKTRHELIETALTILRLLQAHLCAEAAQVRQ